MIFPIFFFFHSSFIFTLNNHQIIGNRVNCEATGSTGIRACARQFQLKPMVESFTKLKAPGWFLIFPRAIISLENNLKTKNTCFENKTPATSKEQGVCHTVALAFTLKRYLKAKEEELWKIQIFHHAKIVIFKKIL